MSEDLRDWAVNNMKIFIKIIQPEIEKYLEEKKVNNWSYLSYVRRKIMLFFSELSIKSL